MKVVLFVLLIAILIELYRIYDVDCVMHRVEVDEDKIDTLISHDCIKNKQSKKDAQEIRALKKENEKLKASAPVKKK